MGDIPKCGKPIRFDYPAGNERVNIPCILTPGHDEDRLDQMVEGGNVVEVVREPATNHVARIEWDADGRLVTT